MGSRDTPPHSPHTRRVTHHTDSTNEKWGGVCIASRSQWVAAPDTPRLTAWESSAGTAQQGGHRSGWPGRGQTAGLSGPTKRVPLSGREQPRPCVPRPHGHRPHPAAPGFVRGSDAFLCWMSHTSYECQGGRPTTRDVAVCSCHMTVAYKTWMSHTRHGCHIHHMHVTHGMHRCLLLRMTDDLGGVL